MIKLIKISLITAMLATSGFAATGVNLQDGGEVQQGATVNFKNQPLTLAENKSLDVYGSLTGTGIIECAGTGTVNIHGPKYQKDDTNKSTILTAVKMTDLTVHTLDESKQGSIDDTVTVNPPETLKKIGADFATYAKDLDDTNLIYVANAGGSDTDCVGGTSTATVIAAALANAITDPVISGLNPSGLVMTNKLKFSGNNSGFTEQQVTIGTPEITADVEYANVNSIFPVETTIEDGSKLTISDTGDVSLNNALTVKGTRKVLIADPNVEVDSTHGELYIKGKLVVTSGTTLTLDSNIEKVKAVATSNYPRVITWPLGSFENEMTTDSNGTITDGIFTYTQEADGAPYERTHGAFLSNTIGTGSGFTRSWFESTQDDTLLMITVYGKGDTDAGKMSTSQYIKETTGKPSYISSGNLTLSVSASTAYSTEGDDTTGI